MRWTIHYRIVEQNEVLIARPTPNIQANRAFANALHSGKRENDFHHIGFTERQRNLLHGLDVEFLDAHLYGIHLGIVLRFYYHFLQGSYFLVKLDVQFSVRVKDDM